MDEERPRSLGRRPTVGERDNEAMDAAMEEAWRLKITGLSYRQIGPIMGVSAQTISNWIRAYRTSEIRTEIAQKRDEVEADLGHLRAAIEPGVLAGDEKSIRVALAINESVRKFWGLDAPTKVEATVYNVTQDDLALAELIREAQARNAAHEAHVEGKPAPEQGAAAGGEGVSEGRTRPSKRRAIGK